MGFFSVPHNMGGCLSGKKYLGTSTFWKNPERWGELGPNRKIIIVLKGLEPRPLQIFFETAQKDMSGNWTFRWNNFKLNITYP